MAPRRGVGLCVTATAMIALLALSLRAERTLAADAALGVVGKDAPVRPVALTRDADGSLTGTVNVPLRNDSDQTVRLVALFFADGGAQPSPVGVGTAPLALAARPARLAPRTTTVLPVTTTLGARESPSDLEGALAIQARSGGKVVATTEVRLTGALALPKDIVFEPPKVTLQITKRWPLRKAHGDETTVRLRGPGVARLVDTVGRLTEAAENNPQAVGTGVAQATTILLTDANGDQALVQLSDLKQTAIDLAEVTVSAQAACPEGATPCEQDAPKPGAYSGALALSPGGTGGPQLDVTVNSELWFVIPLGLLLIGSLIGGLLPQLTQTAEMKERLRGELRPLLDKYDQQAPQGRGLLWDLEAVLGDRPWYEKRFRGLPGDPGVAALWADIHSARSMDELTPDVERVREFCGQVRRWMEVLPLAERLAEVHRARPADRGELHPWSDTNMRRATERELRRLASRLPPKDDHEADTLSAELRRQIEFHEAFLRAWNRRAELDTMKGVSRAEMERDAAWWKKADIDAFDASLPALAENDPDMSDRLTKLAEVSEAIERLLSCYEQDVNPDDVNVSISRARRCAVVAQLESGHRHRTEIALKTGVTVEDVVEIEEAAVEELLPALGAVEDRNGGGTAAAAGGTPDPEGATPTAVATPPATVHRVAPATSTTITVQRNGMPSTAPTGLLGRARHARTVTSRAFAMTDWFVTASIAIGTAVVYMVPFYKGTWGSWQDILTALAAGLAGQVAIKWALLPALRNRRLPQSPSAS